MCIRMSLRMSCIVLYSTSILCNDVHVCLQHVGNKLLSTVAQSTMHAKGKSYVLILRLACLTLPDAQAFQGKDEQQRQSCMVRIAEQATLLCFT